LPPDAEFKGYQTIIVQGLKIQTDNILFKKEVYYSRSKNKTFIGNLPNGHNGGYSPELKALIITMKNAYNMSESKILDFLDNHNIQISDASISNILIKKTEAFDQEKEDLFKAGLESSPYQQIDDTVARVNGENYHTHVICNPLFTAYFTRENKTRLTILKILNLDSELTYRIDHEALGLLSQLRVGKKYTEALTPLIVEQDFNEDDIQRFLTETFPNLSERLRVQILEATGISSYHKRTGIPVVKILLCDDAPQFKLLTEALMLCWVHEGRHYKKLRPVVSLNVKELNTFEKKFWKFYRQLLKYKRCPSADAAKKLSDKFDNLFSTKTGYIALDDRIVKTKQKKEELLLVLKYPDLPLHNNASELAARVSVRKRDISLHTVTDEGTNANDTFLSIIETCRKLGVNAYEYILDRMNKTFALPSLAQLIRSRSFNHSIAFSP
ncbi:MAG: transposase, partial [Candidatus Omnitrophica bacterium]|nr:transposase [Candidatus Omnitrophota bacterium]